MLKRKTSRPRAHDFYDDEDQLPVDIDPEDNIPEFSESEGSGSEDEEGNTYKARQHYAPVEKSKLRGKDTVALGPQYSGSRVPRNGLDAEDEHDPFAEYDSDEGSEVEEEQVNANGINGDVSINGSEDSDGDEDEDMGDFDEDVEDGTDETSIGGDGGEDDEDGSEDEPEENNDRAELRKIMNEEPKNVAATIAQASKADAEKGQAVRQQRKTFDSILNGRIRLQQGLVAVNSMQALGEIGIDGAKDAVKDAEKAAVTLWNTLENLRRTIQDTRTGSKRKHFEANVHFSTSKIWSHMQDTDKENKSYRRNVLEKWSAKTQGATTQPATRRLTGATRQTTIVDILDEQLSNKDRLIKRTRTPRSCAPIQANAGLTEAADIFDDADFYGVMLKELLEQRSIESASNVQVDTAASQWKAVREAKTKKNVDTKASKGRKLRYTVHEKLQNFMAPEDRGTWTERQIDELFGSMLGKRLALGENEVDGVEEVDRDAEEDALMLFRN